MSQMNVHEAKTHLSRLLDAVERGEAITIARHGRPVADLVPHRHRAPVQFGGLVDEIDLDDEAFVAADAEVASLFDDLAPVADQT